MADEIHEETRVTKDEGYERRQRVVEYAPSTQQVLVSRISKLIWLIIGVVSLLVAFRFVLKLIAANPGNAFTDFIYSVTDVLVAPFVGLMSVPAVEGSAVIDIPSIFALIVYPLLAWVVVRLFMIIFAGTNSRRKVTTYERNE